jgi:hypothetical protein
MRRGSGTRRHGCSTRASVRGRAVLSALLVSAAAIGVGPAVAAASAASLKMSVTTNHPTQGAFTVTLSGSTGPYDSSTNKAPELNLYIVDPAAPGTSCQATAASEQYSSNAAVLPGETLSNPGRFSFTNTQNPGNGHYFLCAYVTAITANGGSGGTEAMASAPVTIGAEARLTGRGPIQGTFEGDCTVTGHTVRLGQFDIPSKVNPGMGTIFNLTITRFKRNAGTHAKLAATKDYGVMLTSTVADWGSGWTAPYNSNPGKHLGSGTLTVAKNLESGSFSTSMAVTGADSRAYKKVEHVKASWTCS